MLALRLNVDDPAGPLLAIVISLVKYTDVVLTSLNFVELTMMRPDPVGASVTKPVGRLFQV